MVSRDGASHMQGVQVPVEEHSLWDRCLWAKTKSFCSEVRNREVYSESIVLILLLK
jgi:hypothetical protein